MLMKIQLSVTCRYMLLIWAAQNNTGFPLFDLYCTFLMFSMISSWKTSVWDRNCKGHVTCCVELCCVVFISWSETERNGSSNDLIFCSQENRCMNNAPLSVCLPACLSVYLSVCLSVCLPDCLFVCKSFCLSVCPSDRA